MRNLPKGVWANFTTVCHVCGGDISVRDARPERHTCRIDLDRPTLTDLDHIKWPPPLAG